MMTVEVRRVLSGSLLAAALALSTPLAAAEEGGELEFHNNIAIFFGGATEFADERENSTLLGLEYERRFTPHWGLAAVVEASGGDFKRSHLYGLGATLRPTGGGFRLLLMIGAEYIDTEELEEGEEADRGPEILTRLGASYEFELGRFTIEPALAADLGGETDTVLNYGVAFGFDF